MMRAGLVVATTVLAAVCWITCGELFVTAAEPATAHPHVNMATSYRVDPAWPRRSENLAWAAMSGVAVDRTGHVWVLTRADPPVQVYDAGGEFVRGWGKDAIKAGHGLRLDRDGNVWVTDIDRHVVMQFTPEGRLLKRLGTPGTPGDDGNHFNKPTDVAVSPAGDVFVADGYGNSRIVQFDPAGKFVKEWGKRGIGPGEFSVPHAIVRDSTGRLYVADRNNVRIQVFDENGKFIDQWTNLLVPWGLCITGRDEIWACGSSPMSWGTDPEFLGYPPKDQLVMRLASSGKLLALWTIPKGEKGKEKPGEVNVLHDIAVDAHGNLFLGDIDGKRIQKFVRQAAATDSKDDKVAHGAIGS
jgi:hypothetical protein